MSTQIDSVLKSSLIQKDVPYRILLPDDYSRSEIRCSVLYLLHGLFGSFENWTELTDLSSYSDNYALIVVMPEGGDNWYTDSNGGECQESYLIEDLLPAVDNAFRTMARSEGRAIAGNSMGGYGAFKFALKYPNLFSLAGSFSGAFHAPKLVGPVENANWDELGDSISKIFGTADSRTRAENDIDQILTGLTKEKISALPYFYFDCGSQDGFLEVNREMEQTLLKFGVSHEYHEFEGGHDWPYWNTRIREFLDLAAGKFNVLNRE